MGGAVVGLAVVGVRIVGGAVGLAVVGVQVVGEAWGHWWDIQHQLVACMFC